MELYDGLSYEEAERRRLRLLDFQRRELSIMDADIGEGVLEVSDGNSLIDTPVYVVSRKEK